jgi:hypothetical protein
MKAQKEEEVLNLFYLFNEGDLYKIEGELQPIIQPLRLEAPHSAEERSTAKPAPTSETVKAQEEAIVDIPAPADRVEVIGEQTAPVVSAIAEVSVKQSVLMEKPITNTEPLPVISVPSSTSAVIPPLPAVTEPPKPPSSVLIIVRESRAPLLEAQDEAFLEKVLQAVGSSLDQVKVVNVHQVADPDYHYLFKEKKVRQFISFGVPMEELNLYLELSPYEVKLTHGIQFLSVDTLEGIRTDVERKRGLWAALKQMFNA